MFIFLGWLIGIAYGTVGALALILVLWGTGSIPVPLSPIANILIILIALLTVWQTVVFIVFYIIIGFVFAYMIATMSIAPLLPAATGMPIITFPLGTSATTPTPVTIPSSTGEFFARGLMIGMSAAINTILLGLIPVAGVVLALWAFIVISLVAIIVVANNRLFQGFLGWSGWLFPLSYLATGVGLLYFIVNSLFAFIAFGPSAFAIDWTTGVIETRGGLSGITGFNGGFSLGNFTFLAGTTAATAPPAPGRFTSPSISAHETGHSLSTAAFGGIVLWINAVDQNIFPRRLNLAYPELIAEGHARNMPGVARGAFALRVWF